MPPFWRTSAPQPKAEPLPDGYRQDIWFMYSRNPRDLNAIITDLNQNSWFEVAYRYEHSISNEKKRDIVKSLARAHQAGIVVELVSESKYTYCFFGSPDLLLSQGYPDVFYFQRKNSR